MANCENSFGLCKFLRHIFVGGSKKAYNYSTISIMPLFIIECFIYSSNQRRSIFMVSLCKRVLYKWHRYPMIKCEQHCKNKNLIICSFVVLSCVLLNLNLDELLINIRILFSICEFSSRT